MDLDSAADDNDGLFTNKSVMMANFEEWIKLATDNKINSRNSWNFALIDYFYDLNILRDSQNNINFQKASATLDGCIKIYSSRVDSVSNETGKLLSGLAQPTDTVTQDSSSGSNNNSSKKTNESNGNNDEDYSIEINPITGLPIANNLNDEPLQRRKNYNRVLETTLVPFETIKIKELDQELNIDPLFKKALVDFDEGGSKNLLLNTLSINKDGRVIFDTSIKDSNSTGEKIMDTRTNENHDEDEILEESSTNKSNESDDETDKSVHNTTLNSMASGDTTMSINDEILALGMDLLKFDKLSTSTLSTSLQQLRLLVNDVTEEKNFIDGVNNRFDNFLTEQELADIQPTTNVPDIDNAGIPELGYSMGEVSNGLDDMNDDENAVDINMHSFNQINDNVTENTHNDNNVSFNNMSNDNLSMNLENDDDDDDDSHMDDTTNGSILEQNLMAYFDEALRKNWRGRDHWKVLNVKKNLLKIDTNEKEVKGENNDSNDSKTNNSADTEGSEENSNGKKQKKKKKGVTEINFFEIDDDLEDKIFSTSTKDQNKQSLELSQKVRGDDSHYLLPNDYHFTSERVISLFIKPEQKMSLFKRKHKNKVTSTANNSNWGSSFNQNDSVNEPVDGDLPEIANEKFWAHEYELQELDQNVDMNNGKNIIETEVENPFADEDDDDGNGIDFNQAFDDDNMGDTLSATQQAGLNTKEDVKSLFKDNKVNYSRVSKKVDVRRLKNNVWKSINSLLALKITEDTQENSSTSSNKEITLQFTDIITQLVDFYPSELYKDISTSFCFICLLHLANEYGFSIQNEQNFQDLTITLGKNAQQSITA